MAVLPAGVDTDQLRAPEPVRRVLAVVHENVQWLRAVIAERGWPGRSLVGADGVDAFWLLLQHAGSGVPTIGTPANLSFQASCVPLLETVRTSEAHPRHLAHVVDNQRAPEGTSRRSTPYWRPPFVTKDGELVLRPPLDADTIDANRAAIGLLPLRVDLARRRAGDPPDATEGTRPEPWPA